MGELAWFVAGMAVGAVVVERLVSRRETPVDYEAAMRAMHDEAGLPLAVNVNDFLSEGLEGDERRAALERLKEADREAEAENLRIVKAIVDAASPRLLVDPTTEEER